MDEETLLSHVFDIVMNNGGYLTVRDAAEYFDQQLTQMREGGNKSKNGKRNSSCSSDSSCSSSGGNNNIKNNDRLAANEKNLKALIKSSSKFKLNGNILFVNTKEQQHVTRRKGPAMRRNSLPELASDFEIMEQIYRDLNSKQEKRDSIVNLFGSMTNVHSGVVKSANELKQLLAKHPFHFYIDGDDVHLRKDNNHSSADFSTDRPDDMSQLPLGVTQSTACQTESPVSIIPRSHSLGDCNILDQTIPKIIDSTKLPPSYLATPSCIFDQSALSEIELISKKFQGSDKLGVIMKSFETEVQTAVEKLLKQMRSELDVMLVEMHRPMNKNIGEGKIFHVDKKWGIIDLGNHDHVFFDMSIMLGNVDDMKNHFQIGEVLGFEAVKAQKSSRANWRAVRVWKIGRVEEVQEKMLKNQADKFLKQRFFNVQDKAFNRLCESGSSKGNSPESSPASNKWKKKPINPLSKAVLQGEFAGYSKSTSGHKSVCDDLRRFGDRTNSNWTNTPLIGITSHPMDNTEIRLSPNGALNPSETRRRGLQTFATNSLVDIRRNSNYVGPDLQKHFNGLNKIDIKQLLRDSGTESGNSSPDAIHKLQENPHSQDMDSKSLINACCQTDCGQ